MPALLLRNVSLSSSSRQISEEPLSIDINTFCFLTQYQFIYWRWSNVFHCIGGLWWLNVSLNPKPILTVAGVGPNLRFHHLWDEKWFSSEKLAVGESMRHPVKLASFWVSEGNLADPGGLPLKTRAAKWAPPPLQQPFCAAACWPPDLLGQCNTSPHWSNPQPHLFRLSFTVQFKRVFNIVKFPRLRYQVFCFQSLYLCWHPNS